MCPILLSYHNIATLTSVYKDSSDCLITTHDSEGSDEETL